MKKASKRILSIILVICIITAGTGAFALDQPSSSSYSVMWTHTDALSAGLTINTSGYTSCSATLEISNSTDTGTLKMYLQRYVDGSWSNVTSWSTSGTVNLSLAGHNYVTSGYSYRVHAIAYIYTSGTLVETATQDSYTVYY